LPDVPFIHGPGETIKNKMMTNITPKYAWKDGSLVDWADCTVHVRSQGGFFGTNIFEGVRGYWNPEREQIYAFRVPEHMKRLAYSMKVMRLEVAHKPEEILEGAKALIQACGFCEHIQFNIVAHFGLNLASDPLFPTQNTGVHITAIPFPRSPKVNSGLHTCISSWRRISDDSMPPRVKVGSNYQNSRLAQNEARINGYDMPIILNQRGTVAEGPGSCVFLVLDGELHTPDLASGILESITRATVIELAEQKLGLTVVEREINRTELYAAEEVFTCGSIAELTPVISVDRLPVADGQVGPITRHLQELYFAAVVGELAGYGHWVTPMLP
jgi:branched-chain amino acid aminotransferase